MNRKKTFEIVHKIREDKGDGKEAILIVKFCCERFYQLYNISKIKFDKEDRHGNEYPYVELLSLEDSPLETKGAELVYITHCFYCGYQFHPNGFEQKLYKHNQYWTR